MLGAIIGDVVGSRFEFHNIKTKEFDLITRDSCLTDDSMMTLAVAEILQKNKADDKEFVIDTFKKWGRTYPDAGYGGYFFHWLMSDERSSYKSYGNGAAMRVSACGWYGRDEEEVKHLSRCVTEVTHSHPEGIKGAEVTATCVYYARIGKSKEFIKRYVEQYYSLDFDYEELRRSYYHGEEICQNTVPQAIFCFLISEDFEDCLRTTISIGGDCDTTAAISCAIAEAYYKYIDSDLIKKVFGKLPSAEGDCNAREIFRRFLEFKAYESVACEEISDETAVVCHETDDGEVVTVECGYSKSFAALGNYVFFSIAEKESWNSIESYLKLNVNSFDELNSGVQKILLRDDNGEEDKYVLFADPSAAVEYLNGKSNVKSEVYSEIFSKTYRFNEK